MKLSHTERREESQQSRMHGIQTGTSKGCRSARRRHWRQIRERNKAHMSHMMSVHMRGMLLHQPGHERKAMERTGIWHAPVCFPCLHSLCVQPDPSPPVLFCPYHVTDSSVHTSPGFQLHLRKDMEPLAKEGRSVFFGTDLGEMIPNARDKISPKPLSSSSLRNHLQMLLITGC